MLPTCVGSDLLGKQFLGLFPRQSHVEGGDYIGVVMQQIDLRSDTVTKPTAEMRDVMATAEVGDDVYHEDPSVHALEADVASLLGKEAALFVPSGTMANQIALNLHTSPGDSVLCEIGSHIFYYEAGGAAVLSGVQPTFIAAEDWLNASVFDDLIQGSDIHLAQTTLVVVENTHNRSGGRALSLAEVDKITQRAKQLGLKTHCDGARIWNAAISTGASEKDLARGFETVSVCFSKGLGAPVGSAICGPRELIEHGRKIRKRLGGGMRQAGILAAAACYALKNHRCFLFRDQERCKRLAQAMSENDSIELKMPPEDLTTMLYFRVLKMSAHEFVTRCHERGILLQTIGDEWIRAVIHFQINDDDIDFVLASFDAILG